MKIILHPTVNLPQVKYVFKTIFEDFFGLPNLEFSNTNQKTQSSNTYTIYYGPTKLEENIYNMSIYSSELWSNKIYLTKDSLPERPLKKYNGKELPKIILQKTVPILYLAYNDDFQEPYIRTDNKEEVITNIDFIASIFFMLTGYQEVVEPESDNHGRYPVQASLAFQEGFLNRPIVNEYLEIMWHWMEKTGVGITRANRKFRLMITHDVDHIKLGTWKKRIKRIIAQIIRRKSIKGFFRSLWRNILWFFTPTKNTFKYIVKMGKKYDLESYFFFLTTGSSQRYDKKRYDFSSEEVQTIIKMLQTNGHNIGIHCSYSSFLNEKQLKREKELFEKNVRIKKYGVRKHYLRFKIPESYRLLDECGFAFDCTVSFAEYNGYRTGSCYPFHPFDVVENQVLNIIEYPLIIMEGTLTGENYQNISSPKKVLEIIKDRIDQVVFYNGCFVFLIHNHSFEELEFPWRTIYKQILNYCKTKESNSET